MFFITDPDERPDGWVNLSNSNDWQAWLRSNIPVDLDQGIRDRLSSNLKHILVGLELKKALILPHAQREGGEREVLFEPYFQILTFEFCVGAFSVLEGIGASHWLGRNGRDGADNPRIDRVDWQSALCAVYDPDAEHGLEAAVQTTSNVRDKLHQDRLGARVEIDWHAMGYDPAFLPANHAIGTLLYSEANLVPARSNLKIAPA